MLISYPHAGHNTELFVLKISSEKLTQCLDWANRRADVLLQAFISFHPSAALSQMHCFSDDQSPSLWGLPGPLWLYHTTQQICRAPEKRDNWEWPTGSAVSSLYKQSSLHSVLVNKWLLLWEIYLRMTFVEQKPQVYLKNFSLPSPPAQDFSVWFPSRV